MNAIIKHMMKYAVVVTFGMIALFFLMKLLGLVQNTNLRVLNAVIMFFGVFLSVKGFRKGVFEYNFNYLTGISVGFFTGFIASILFGMFLGGYFFLNEEFLNNMLANKPYGANLNFLTIPLIIIIEGVASSLIFSFIAMQYFKKEPNIES